MQKRPQIILGAVLALLLLVGGGLYVLGTQLDAVVARLIEEQGSAATGSDVRVGGVAIALKDARGEIARLTVANPPGYGSGPAVELGRFAIGIDPGSLTSDTIVLDEVTVEGARLHLEQQGADSNLGTLLAALRGEAAGGDSAPAAQTKLIIERFVLRDASALVSLPELDEVREVTLPTIELQGIGRASNGATAAAVARQVLEPVLRRALQSAAAGALEDKAREKLDDARDKVLDGVLERIGGHDDTGS